MRLGGWMLRGCLQFLGFDKGRKLENNKINMSKKKEEKSPAEDKWQS